MVTLFCKECCLFGKFVFNKAVPIQHYIAHTMKWIFFVFDGLLFTVYCTNYITAFLQDQSYRNYSKIGSQMR